ncbi:CesT family type III secretion system chaperone [Ramlibacter albus]|uniref:CesT family type III secretion system chaperone n=1 Tax=Ramlibacter albus TaxID=2079448 RepID=A0A923S483_9BURK|nr:CesT family type III secretion system chaperone [Ramlibacter albus]MBC5766643.1 CesT family type III secretion system chaperone [Ramlibacter albus]
MPEAPDDFSALAHSLCEAARAPAPPLERDAEGGIHVDLDVGGVAVTVTHLPDHFPAHVFVLVAFGPLPHEGEAASSREFLDANLLMMRPGAPVFGRDPLDGQVVLHACCAMANVDGELLLAGIGVAAGMAREWRRTGRLAAAAHEEAMPFGAAVG